MDTESVFYKFIERLQQNFVAEILCLVSQLLLTFKTIHHIYNNSLDFPIKQLSPYATIMAISSFLLGNILLVTGKIIQVTENLYDHDLAQCKGQCRLYNHSYMIALAILYNIFRELPFIIFAAKTFRVCLCYFPKFYELPQPPKLIIGIFKNEFNMLILSATYMLIIQIANAVLLNLNITAVNNSILFEYFCPKVYTILDSIIDMLRFILLFIVYLLSIYTYKQLDFKRFLLLLFLIAASQSVLRIILINNNLDNTTYHEFYYHAFILQFFGTLAMVYFTKSKQKANQLATPSILNQWNAFNNVELCYKILLLYAEDLDKQTYDKTQKGYSKRFNEFIYMGQLIKINFLKKDFIPDSEKLLNILQDGQRIGLSKDRIQKLRIQINAGDIRLIDLREIENHLSKYCKDKIYTRWKKTISYRTLKVQFTNNLNINDKLYLLGISID